jgi:phosphate transport system substrate-binding protein
VTLVLGVNCKPYDVMVSGSITVQGSDSAFPFMLDEASYFMDIYPKATIKILAGGSAAGLNALFNGKTQIAVTSYPMDDKARALAKTANILPKEYKVALDGVAVIVNPRNPIAKLTLNELKGIFSGRIKNFKEINGPDLPIRVFIRTGTSGTYEFFRIAVLGDTGYSAHALPLETSKAIVDSVMNNPAAIGYIGMGYTYRAYQPLTPEDRVKVLALANDKDSSYVQPNQETVNNKTYPLWRTLYLYTNGEPKALDAGFIAFLMSTKGQKIVAADGLVPAAVSVTIQK